MSEMPTAIARRVQAAVRYAMSAFRAQARTGPVTKKVTDDILFRGAHEIIQALRQEPRDTRVLLWPATVRLMLATFLEAVLYVSAATPAPRRMPPGHHLPDQRVEPLAGGGRGDVRGLVLHRLRLQHSAGRALRRGRRADPLPSARCVFLRERAVCYRRPDIAL